MICPNEPTGSSSAANWFRRLRGYVQSLEIKPGLGYKVSRSSSGTILQIAPGVGAGSGNETKQFVITTIGDWDYVKCKEWDAITATASGDEIAVAKDARFRHKTVTREYFDGETVNYTPESDGNNGRTATISNPTETESQVAFPRYTTLAILQALGTVNSANQAVMIAQRMSQPTGVKDSLGVDVYWLEIRPSRVWAKQYS